MASETLTLFLERLHLGGEWAYLWTKEGKRSYWYPVGKPAPTVNGPARNVYFGVHTTAEIPQRNAKGEIVKPDKVRSQVDYVDAINCLFAEFDGKDFVPDMVQAALIKYGVKKFKDLPQDVQGLIAGAGKPAALARVEGLEPGPSVVIDSGGGYHGYWLLADTWALIGDDDRQRAQALQAAWVTFTGGDQGAKDLARVLRLPGSHNHKYDPPRAVEFVWCDLTLSYPLDALESAVRGVLDNSPTKAADTTRKSGPRASGRSYSVTDDIARAEKNLERLSMVRCDNYGSWIDVGMSLSELGTVGLTLWDRWSQKSDKYKPGKCAEKWETFTPGGGLTLASLGQWAKDDDPRPGGAGIGSCNLSTMIESEPPLADLAYIGVDGEQAPRDRVEIDRTIPLSFPELPESARLDPELGKDACPWLDTYVAFSRKWSPRSFDGFHENTGLHVLSTLAARRVLCHYGRPRYTNNYAMLMGRTTIHGKSSAADIGDQTLRACGLGFLLAADESTPASFVRSLANRSLPADFDAMSIERQDEALVKLGFAAQRGWYYEEFGSGLSSMMRTDGVMADFRSLLRRLDDCPGTYERDTIARGSELVERPYLALIANLTPADLKPLAGKGSQLWGDGFLARFNFVTPPANEILRGQYPRGERIIPPELIEPLVDWHKRLGIPQVDLIQKPDKDGDPVTKTVVLGDFPQKVIAISADVFEATYRYLDGLMDIAERSTKRDLDGCLGRFHI